MNTVIAALAIGLALNGTLMKMAEQEASQAGAPSSAGAQSIQQLPAPAPVSPIGTASNAVQITNGPVVEIVTDTTAQIAWSTNIKGSTRVTYGTDMGNLGQLAEAPWGVGGLTHRVQLKNLKPGTTYFFQVETGQAAGSEVESHIFSFRTPNAGEAALHHQQPQPVR